MKKNILFFLLLISLIPVKLKAQTGIYRPLGGGMNNGSVGSMVVDSSTNELYVAGGFNIIGGDSIKFIAKWDGNHWDSIPELPISIQKFEYLDHILYAYGSESLWKKEGVNWTLIATTNNQFVNCLALYNNDLIIMGGFDSLNGMPFNSIARYDGSNLYPFSDYMTWPINGRDFKTAAVYNGELYVGGNQVDASGVIKRLMKWDGSHWISVGTGIVGTFAAVSKLIVYDNKLFVAGSFDEVSGNPGSGLFSYDGVVYNNLNGGLHIGVLDMAIHNDELFIVGPCSTNSGREFKGFLTFNGNDFCFYDSVACSAAPWPEFSRIAFYNDSLIVGGGIYAYNGDTINNIATYQGDYTVSQNCEQVIGIEEMPEPGLSCDLYPNPTQSTLTIQFSQAAKQTTTLQIKNMLGQTIKTTQLAPGEKQSEIDVSALSNGLYFLQYQSGNQLISKKFVKQ